MVSKFSEYNTFSFDIETTGLNPIDSRILLVQIGFPDHTYIISGQANLSPILPFFSSNKWLKIIQNAKFDTKFLYHYYNTRTTNIFDTMLAEQIIQGTDTRGKASLEALALTYLDKQLDKSIRSSFYNIPAMQMFTDEQLKYAAEDAEILFAIKNKQEAKLQEEGLQRVADLEFELSPVVARMELTGVPVNKSKWGEILEDYKEKHEEARLRMHEELFDKGGLGNEQMGLFTRDSINLNSPAQIKKAFNEIGIDIDKTDERTLAKNGHPAARAMLEYRKLQKAITSYGTSFLDKIHPFTGRIHADYQQIGTATGRFACKEPNLQQMPEEFRACVSENDYMIVGADYSNIELRILAELSGDKALKSAFETGQDPHKSTAAIMFDIPLDSVTKEQRFIAKTINFGISYGMGPGKLQDMLNKDKPKKDQLSFRAVSKIMDKYKETYRAASNWLLQAGNLAYRQSYSTTMMGRKRYYDRPSAGGDWDQQVAAIKRQGANSPIQGTNADITKLAMLNLDHDLRTYNFNANIILQVHDEIGVLAHKSNAESVKQIVVESMEASAQELLKEVPVKVDAYVSEVWKK